MRNETHTATVTDLGYDTGTMRAAHIDKSIFPFTSTMGRPKVDPKVLKNLLEDYRDFFPDSISRLPLH